MLIKTRNFSPTKCENTTDKDGFGWAPGHEKKFEGVGGNKCQYNKNFTRAKGLCIECDKYIGDASPVSKHCSLPDSENCQN